MLANAGTGNPRIARRVQGKLRQILADHGDHAGVVGPRADLAEVNIVILDEELHAKEPATAELLGDRARQSLALGQSTRSWAAAARTPDSRRLLTMPDRVAE